MGRLLTTDGHYLVMLCFFVYSRTQDFTEHLVFDDVRLVTHSYQNNPEASAETWLKLQCSFVLYRRSTKAPLLVQDLPRQNFPHTQDRIAVWGKPTGLASRPQCLGARRSVWVLRCSDVNVSVFPLRPFCGGEGNVSRFSYNGRFL